MSFPTQMLQDLGTIYTGSTPKTNDESLFGGDIPFVTPGDLGEITPIHTATRSLTEEGAKTGTLLPAGAVLVCCIGSLGKIGFAGKPLVTNQQINAVVFDGKKIDPRYGFFACRLLKPQLESMAPATTVPIVNKSRFSELKIPVPPLEEQRRIAVILDQAETLRTQRRTALALLDSLTQSLFLDMFGDPVANPKGWPFTRLDQLVRRDDSINYGVVQPGDALDEGVPLVRVGDVVDENFDPAALKRIDAAIEQGYKRSRLRGDEILVTCVGSIGVVALVEPSMKGFNIARAVSRIPVSAQVNRVFLASYLRTDYVQRYFTSELRTVSQPTLNIKQICETRVIQPPLDLQQTFATRIAAIEALKATHRRALAALDALFASLQQRAFAGAL